jgi:hypothetical protein
MKAGFTIFTLKQDDSMEWNHATSPNKKKARTIPLARNMMRSVFWDAEG